MIGNRSLFVFTCLFLVMVMNVSTAPVDDEEGEDDIAEEIMETTAFSDVVTDNLLFFSGNEVPMAGDVQKDDLLFEKGFKHITPVVPVADHPVTPSD